MTEDQFDNTIVVAGSDDYRLQMYYQGYGCYFQGLVVETIALGPLHTQHPEPTRMGESYYDALLRGWWEF